MPCLRPIEQIRLLSGEASTDEAVRGRAHLADCQACAASFAELQRTWTALAAWHVDTSMVDLADAVVAGSHANLVDILARRRGSWAVLARTAAAIALAAGLGIGSGRLVSGVRQPVGDAHFVHLPVRDVPGALASAYAATDSATGLTLGFATRGEGGEAP